MSHRHTRLFGSTSARTLACPAHLQRSEGRPEQPSSAAAEEGTMIHDIVAQVLEDADKEHALLAPLTLEQRQIARKHIDFVRGLVEDGGRLYVEKRTESPHLHPEWFGTADVVVVKPPLLIIADLKCGRIPVEVDYDGDINPQLASYAISVLENLKPAVRSQIKQVETIIIQPREGGIKRRFVSLGELADMKFRLLEAAKLAERPNPPAHAGKHCTFCRALAVCETAREKVQSSAKLDFMPQGPSALPAEDMDELLREAHYAEKWIAAVKDEAKRILSTDDGDILGRWELVPTRATRRWKDESQAERFLRDAGLSEVTVTKTISPAQARLLARENNVQLDGIDDLIVAESSGVKLAAKSPLDGYDEDEWS